MTNAAAVDHDEPHRLTVVEGLAALSLDALSSVAYGPEAAPASTAPDPSTPPDH